jgi:hypothetical protein
MSVSMPAHAPGQDSFGRPQFRGWPPISFITFAASGLSTVLPAFLGRDTDETFISHSKLQNLSAHRYNNLLYTHVNLQLALAYLGTNNFHLPGGAQASTLA